MRSAQFYEEVSRGSLYLIGERLATDKGALQRLEAAFDASIAIRPQDEGPDDEYERSRLLRGQVIVTVSPDGKTASMRSMMPDGQWLYVDFNKLSELQARATARLLVELWQRSGEPIESFLADLQSRFGYPLSVEDIVDLEISATDLSRMQYGDVLVQLAVDGAGADAYIKIPGAEQVVRLGPVEKFNPYSLRAVFVIGTIGVLLIGLGVYWVVNLRHVCESWSRRPAVYRKAT